MIRIKPKLVCKGYAQLQGIYFLETFARIEILEVISMFLSFSNHNNTKLYKMDVKLTFLSGYLEEEIYIKKTKCFTCAD